MPRKHQPTNWAPTIFDDHGQPLCDTEEQEQQIYNDLEASGPDDHIIWITLDETADQLAANWGVKPTDHTTIAVIAVRLAEQARKRAIDILSTITRETNQQHLHQDIAAQTGIAYNYLTTTYPINQQPPF